jgi:stearoyl-CoA desaturase (delta-9 desaturase)
MGEGWHNNHHYYQSTANQGFFWWEVDCSYYILKMLSWVGVVWDLRTPPAHILAGKEPVSDAVSEVVSEAISPPVPPAALPTA